MSLDHVREILGVLGVEAGGLQPDCRLRSDLALDSTETTELELELRRRFNVRIDLWDKYDYSLEELASRISASEGRGLVNDTEAGPPACTADAGGAL